MLLSAIWPGESGEMDYRGDPLPPGGFAGSMLAGLATPTEASAIGALGAALLAIAYRRFSYAGLKRAVLSTTATSSMVLLLAVTYVFINLLVDIAYKWLDPRIKLE